MRRAWAISLCLNCCSLLDCGDMSPQSDWGTRLPVSKRGHVVIPAHSKSRNSPALSKLAACIRACFTACVKLPYKVATLLYCFNERDEILLLERAQEPNRGLWSPCGGKLHTDEGESPYACACREAHEETGQQLTPRDLHLTGIISEHGFQGQTHWLMFLFEVKPKLKGLPPVHREGRFQFFTREALDDLKLPMTDREKIWPWFWQHRGGFFAAHCHCHPDGRNEWVLEDSRFRPSLIL